MQLPQAHRAVLLALAHRLPIDDVAWAITGSAGLALQGVDVAVNDLDIQTDATDWQLVQDAFAQQVTKAVTWAEAGTIRSFFGRLDIDGVTVEIVGAPEQRRPDGTWTEPADPRLHRNIIDSDGVKLPVLSLEWEQYSYSLLGRHDKAKLIASAQHP